MVYFITFRPYLSPADDTSLYRPPNEDKMKI